MSPFTTRVAIVVITAVPLAVVFYEIGRRFVERSPGLQKLGAALLLQKDRSLERWPLNRYVALLHDGRMVAASLLLGVLILVKSFASLLAGPIAVIWLPPACLTIPPLGRAFAQAQGRSGANWSGWMANQTALQLTSHLAAAALGASAWWGLLRGEGSLWAVMMQSPSTTAGLLAASVVFAAIAGWYEATGHVRHGLL